MYYMFVSLSLHSENSVNAEFYSKMRHLKVTFG